jgi:hypothetical protein
MVLVKLKGMKPDAKKVTLTKLFKVRCGIGLADAKAMTDKLLEGATLELVVASESQAIEILSQAEELGVECSEYIHETET